MVHQSIRAKLRFLVFVLLFLFFGFLLILVLLLLHHNAIQLAIKQLALLLVGLNQVHNGQPVRVGGLVAVLEELLH